MIYGKRNFGLTATEKRLLFFKKINEGKDINEVKREIDRDNTATIKIWKDKRQKEKEEKKDKNKCFKKEFAKICGRQGGGKANPHPSSD